MQLSTDLKSWYKSLFKKKNHRFKNNIHQSFSDKLPYSKAIFEIFAINTIVFIFLWACEFTPYYETIFSNFATTTNLDVIKLKPWTVFLYGFTHQALFHYFFNIMAILMCTYLIGDILTNKQVWFVYIISVLAGSLSVIFIYNIFPYDPLVVQSVKMVGASAGVFGLIIVVAIKNPKLPLRFIFFPSTLMNIIYINIALSVAMIIFNFNAGGGIAHIAGAIVGFMFLHRLDKGMDLSVNPFRRKNKPLEFKSQYSKETEDVIRAMLKKK